MPEGTIVTIRPDRDDDCGFGLIAPDEGGPNLMFVSRSAEGTLQRLGRVLHNLRSPAIRRGTPFAQLHVGQRVTFLVGADGPQAGRACAEHVRPQSGDHRSPPEVSPAASERA